ncbi:hypothetical protein CHS0354_032103 [Potamilus streckersoni]|uniref:Uncharacterized protein n=1 Tax=Potamilus streckersoni TaxID=2493646 RepID=A0AAE0RLZ4_9BIVA|nr:hypothetical protein CHS0354_032103 [Potamilus streckersoni]
MYFTLLVHLVKGKLIYTKFSCVVIWRYSQVMTTFCLEPVYPRPQIQILIVIFSPINCEMYCIFSHEMNHKLHTHAKSIVVEYTLGSRVSNNIHLCCELRVYKKHSQPLHNMTSNQSCKNNINGQGFCVMCHLIRVYKQHAYPRSIV